MATVVNTLYPPVVSTFAKAFNRYKDMIVYFSISKYNSETDIKRVHISVSLQTNNESALSDSTGVLFSSLKYSKEKGMYYVSIPSSAMNGNSFLTNQYYKIQIRFDCYDYDSAGGSNPMLMDSAAKTDYLLNYQTYFSEWSSVCLVRAISAPAITLKTFKEGEVPAMNKGTISVVGAMAFTTNDGSLDNSETETMQSYKVQVLDRDKESVLKETSTIYSGNSVSPNGINTTIDLQTLDTSEASEFVLRVVATTKDMYEVIQDYDFSLNSTIDVDTFSPEISEAVDNETGIVTISVKNVKSLPSGSILIKRLSSEDNFSTPELIWSGNVVGAFSHTVTDNTVAALVWYRYSVQYLNSVGAGSPVYYSRTIMPDFYDAILSRKDTSFAIRYNYSVSSMKPVVNRTKVDTLGGRYPKFSENAILNYKQFSISGLISAESDAYQTFLEKNNVFAGNMANYYETYKLHPHDSILPDASKGDEEFSSSDPDAVRDLVRNDFQQWKKFDDFAPIKDSSDRSELESTTDSYLTTTQNDWLWERKFREELVKWLNDGEPKLYRSMTEGNMVVMLTDISLTPTSNRSRFNYNFSATVYEVADASSLENLDSLGIYTVHQATASSESGGGSSGGDDDSFVEVTKVGQTYGLAVSTLNKGNVKDIIFNNLKTIYGATNSDSDVWDEKNVRSSKRPSGLSLKNIKIYFHSRPSLYRFDNGTPTRVMASDAYSKTSPVSLGYTFELMTSASSAITTIFVNEGGYYQIPDDVEVEGLYFNNASTAQVTTDGLANGTSFDTSDVVTLEYTMLYKEYDNSAQTISSATQDRTVVGQYEGVFSPNVYFGDTIRNKYNYSNANTRTSQKMAYWKGICLDVTPFAMFKIQYKNSTFLNEYMVGQTGVLHLLKDFEVQDICFTGRRMNVVPASRSAYLKEWECFYDTSNKTYSDTNQIINPQVNCVYSFAGGNFKIYYLDGSWYNYQEMDIDTTNVSDNKATSQVGLAEVPITGQVNYYGTVMQTSYN